MSDLANLGKLINEVSENGKLFTDIDSENKKNNKSVEDDGKKRIDDSTPENSATQIKGYRGENQPYGRNALNLKYDSIDKKYQERVKALVNGKASPNQPDIDDETAGGVSIKGNNTFYEKMKKDNESYGNVMGATYINDRIAQPPKSKDGFPTEGKVKKGDIFTETKNNVNLSVTGLNENKSRVTFVDESGKKYSMTVETFKKAVKESKIVRSEVKQLNEVAPLVGAAIRAGAPLLRTAGTAAAMSAGNTFGNNAGEAASNKLGIGKDGTEKEITSEEKEVTNENKIKRLKFNKTRFISESHVKSLIPEQYKSPGNKILMVDNCGNEYLMECDNYNQSIVLEHKNEQKIKSNFDNMKRLWEYSTKQAVGGTTLNESDVQRKLQKKLQKYNTKK